MNAIEQEGPECLVFPRYQDDVVQWKYRPLISWLFSQLGFNLVVKYDDCWWELDECGAPYDDFGDEELWTYIAQHGQVLNHEPVAWAFETPQAFLNIYSTFFNAEEMLHAQNFSGDVEKGCGLVEDQEIINYWTRNSDVILMPLRDFMGLILFSKIPALLDGLAAISQQNGFQTRRKW